MIDCACLEASDLDGDAPTFYRKKEVKARKAHECSECLGAIKRGDLYLTAVGVWEGCFETFKTCLDCVSIGRAFYCGGLWIHGCLWGEIGELLYPGECLSKIMLELTETARGKVLKWMEDHDITEE